MTILTLGYLLLILGYGPTRGLYQHAGQIALLAASWLVLLLPLIRARKPVHENRSRNTVLLTIIVTLSFVLFVGADRPIYLAAESGMRTLIIIQWCALLVWCAYILEAVVEKCGNPLSQWCAGYWWYRWLIKYRFSLLIGIAFLLRVLVIGYVPTPAIDVFYMMKDGPRALLTGANPYSVEYANPLGIKGPLFMTDVYGYPPGMLLISIPMQVFFEDPRIGYLAAQALTGFLLFLIARRGARVSAVSAELIVLAYFYIPNSLFVAEQAWNEPYVIALLAFIAYGILRQWRTAAYAAAGLLLSVKQTAAPFVSAFVVYAWNTRYMRRGMLLMGAVSAFIIFPFILWNTRDFLYDVIIHLAAYGAIPHALSMSTLYWRTTGLEMPKSVTLLYTAGFILLMCWRMRKNGFAGLVHAATLYLLGVFIIHRGFANYYYFISAALILLMALSLAENQELSPTENAVLKNEMS